MDAYLQLDAQGNLQGPFQYHIFRNAVSVAGDVFVPGLAGEQDINIAVSATLSGAETGVQVTLTSFSVAVAEQVSGVGV